MDRRRRIVGIASLAGGLVLLAGLLCYKRPKEKEEANPGTGSEMMGNIPHGDIKDVTTDKVDGYAVQSGRVRNTMTMYDTTGIVQAGTGADNEDPLIALYGPGATAPQSPPPQRPHDPKTSGGLTPEDLIPTYDPSPASTPPSHGNPYAETPGQREERHRRRREEAIELADRMAGGGDRPQKKDDGGAASPKGASTDPAPSDHVDVGSRPAASADRIITSVGTQPSTGVSSLGGEPATPTDVLRHPYRCAFLDAQKVSDGQRVAIRLLEDLPCGEFVIPRNTHLSAYVRIGTRLELEVSSIEYGGRLITLGYEAYDADGTRGIYCPEAGDARRTARTSGLGVLGSTIGGRVGRIASEAVNTGISIIQNASGQRTVAVTAGYTFFLVKKKDL